MNDAKNKYIKEIVQQNKDVIKDWKQKQEMRRQFINF